jgi:hypothetical protein
MGKLLSPAVSSSPDALIMRKLASRRPAHIPLFAFVGKVGVLFVDEFAFIYGAALPPVEHARIEATLMSIFREQHPQGRVGNAYGCGSRSAVRP